MHVFWQRPLTNTRGGSLLAQGHLPTSAGGLFPRTPGRVRTRDTRFRGFDRVMVTVLVVRAVGLPVLRRGPAASVRTRCRRCRAWMPTCPWMRVTGAGRLSRSARPLTWLSGGRDGRRWSRRLLYFAAVRRDRWGDKLCQHPDPRPQGRPSRVHAPRPVLRHGAEVGH